MKKKKENRKLKELKHKTRRFSIKEGIFASIRNSLGDSYVAPFAIAINSSNSMIAMLSAITGLLGPISQWQSSRLLENHSRKKILINSVILSSIVWASLIIIAFLFYKGIWVSSLPLLLLIFFSIYILVANIAYPAWFSWMGDVVDEGYRGKWFSKRNYVLGIITLIFTILAAFFLDFFKKNNWIMIGFMILFSLALISRLICCYYFKKSYEPRLRIKKKSYFSFFQFIKKAPSNNFGKFSIFRALMEFAAHIATPLFAVYMLRNLGFNYITFMAVVLAHTLFGIFIIKWWGKFADKYGNYNVLKITAILLPIYPVLWLISGSPIFLILCPSLVKGVAIAGFNLAGGNFVYDSVKPEKRALAVSYYNLLTGIGIFLGAGLGAILVKTLTINFMDVLLFIFLISGFARLIVSLTMIPFIKEVRKTKKLDSRKAIESLFPRKIRFPILEGPHELFIRRKFK